MNRSQLYSKAKELYKELGQNPKELKSLWRSSTKKFWQNKIKKYERDIKFRNKNYNRAIILARSYGLDLKLPNTLSGTSRKEWTNEVARLRAKNKRIVEKRKRDFNPVIQELRQASIQNETRNLIRSNNFTELLSRISQGITYTPRQADRIISKMTSGTTKYFIDIQLPDRKQTIAASARSKKFLKDILTTGFVVIEGGDYESDVLNDIEIEQIVSMTPFIPGIKISTTRDGSFFPYINSSDLDLSKYQIYTQEQANELKNREHCLIEALSQNGIEEYELNRVKLTFSTGLNFPKSSLKQVAIFLQINIILYTYDKKGLERKEHYKPEQEADREVHIALYQNHYFKYEKTNYSKFYICNYEKFKGYKDAHRIVRLHSKTKNPVRSDDCKINSLLLVKKFYEKGYFQIKDLSKFDETGTHRLTKDHYTLSEKIEEEQREVKSITAEREYPFETRARLTSTLKKVPQTLGSCKQEQPEAKNAKDKPKIFFADTEAFVNNDENKHELYLLGWTSKDDDDDDVFIYNTNDFRGIYDQPEKVVVNRFLDDITACGRNKKCVVYFHNLKYDYNILEPYLNLVYSCQKDSNIYSCTVIHRKCQITFKDSFKLIPFALEKFAKEFQLDDAKKEAINYSFYTRENENKRIKIHEYAKGLPYKEQKIFYENVKEEFDYDPKDKTFIPGEYYKTYLELDCIVLKKGLEKFNQIILNITKNKLSCYDCLTISSLTDKYMILNGCYNGVYEMQGNLRQYVSNAIYGGRVCVNEKYKKKVIKGKISDYDGVSLYPSAIYRLCRELGLPKGKAVVFQKNDLGNWQSKDYSILTVKITKVNKKQQMPFICERKEDGSMDYTNEPPKNEIIIDSTTLQDYIKFHQIEYEVIEGVYWNNGFNKKLGQETYKLFTERLKAKAQKKKALSNTIKLMLNSIYGKTITKKANSHKIFKKKSEIQKYVCNQFNLLKYYREVNPNLYEVELMKLDNSHNRAHIGCMVLSMSKRIMNEVFDVANDNNLPIYYTDTDSMHLNYDDVPILEEKFEERYNKTLNGKDLEQFHTDFDLDGAEEEIYATKSIFLGKKSYCDVLESKDINGNKITGYHIRMKGATKEGLENCAKIHNGHFNVYKKLSQGEQIDCVLNPFNEDENKQKVLFQFGKGCVYTKREFVRKLKF